MISFIGDYSCKFDTKGRVALPSAFKRQMQEGVQDGFVLKSDVFEKCLILYPMKEWERQNKAIRSMTNPFNKEHAKFLRMFFSGTAEVMLKLGWKQLWQVSTAKLKSGQVKDTIR
jgi:MraZ protein